MAKKKKVDFNLASQVFGDASLADKNQKEEGSKTLVHLSDLVQNPYQPRLDIDFEDIKELADSIKKNGLLQAITVLNNNDGTYTIVYGHRRVAAYMYLEKVSIEANILNSLSEKDLVITPIVENLQRKDMEPIETAIALDSALKMKIVSTQEELSKAVGLSQGRVSKILSILKLSKEVLVEVKKIKYKDATVLAALNKVPSEKQFSVFDDIKTLKRADALNYIQKIKDGKKAIVKRIVHSNNSIKINTKGISKDQKDKVMYFLKEIEKIIGN